MSYKKLALRWLNAQTYPLPDKFSDTERGLMTWEEYLDHSNPERKIHDTTYYDATLDSLNQKNFQHLGFVVDGKNKRYSVYKAPKALIMENPRTKEILGFIHNGIFYYGMEHNKRDLPISYIVDIKRVMESLPIKGYKKVKYISDYLYLTEESSGKPHVLQRLKNRGEYFTVESDGALSLNEGSPIRIVNSSGQVVAQASDEWGATLLQVAKEYQGRGFGTILGEIWYEWNPAYTSGGHTIAGLRNAKRRWDKRVREFLARGWYSELIKQGRLSREKLRSILGDLDKRPKRIVYDSEEEKKGQLLMHIGNGSFVLYDSRFLDFPKEKYIYGHGFIRYDIKGNPFIYRLDYDSKYRKLATSIMFQIAKDMGAMPLYQNESRGADMLELEGVPNVVVEGNRISLLKDFVNLEDFKNLETVVRKSKDPYNEKLYSLLEIADSKWR